ncbi:Uma2 family endonuclease [Limnothrix sp. FACHB-881]|uniref:Uma2 family endonuclease n=1 Tax=Limnothrix sp. FACHB-881 TaxID=2692819 RepID=UPI0016857FFE|nr:Uma2 family endonuclease [Limnothrix sp. FACHB-881]MBD2633925.1 Uma2 family endonuclease [Limnothrix sp. FACHB-881]
MTASLSAPVAAESAPEAIDLNQFLALPDTQPASEFINGKIIQKPMPQGEHSTLQADLVAAINAVLKQRKIARAYTELRCTFGGQAIVPDLSVFLWDRIPRNATTGRVANQFLIPPDWAIEILSPKQASLGIIDKLLHCAQHGTQMGWLIDPDQNGVLTINHDCQISVFRDANDRLPVPEFAAEFQLTLGQLFDWLAVD